MPYNDNATAAPRTAFNMLAFLEIHPEVDEKFSYS
jgi:hypothetical protein